LLSIQSPSVKTLQASFKSTFLFIKYGGEWITYRDDDKPTIYKIYEQLKNKE
jgi:hypothetical protein